MILETTTTYGPVKGIHGIKPSIAVFKGIPYAAPPVGEKRWTAPEAPAPWTEPLICADFRAMPVQQVGKFSPPKEYPLSEDCLYLNVWTPAETKEDRLPVIVWIYGGAYKSGCANDPCYDGEAFAKKGCLLVTFNYRVGPIGFFAHAELTDEAGHCGNYGSLDQVFAIRWVHENIAAFGGDPENVTLMGQSAGAHSVMTMCTTPLTRGCISRAIIQSTGGTSGLYLQDEQTLDAAMEEGKYYLSLLGVNTVDEARKLPAETIVDKLSNAKLSSKAPWFPKTDGYLLKDGTITTILKDEQHPIDFLIGATSWETGFMSSFMSAPTEDAIRAFAERVFPLDPDGYMKSVDISSEETRKQAAFDQYENDKVCANLGWQACRLAAGRKPAWLYHFTKNVPAMDGKRIPPFHSADVAYAFGTCSRQNDYYIDGDRALSALMVSYWTNFAKNGDPNGDGLPEWKRSTYYNEAMELGDRVGMFDIPLTPNRIFITEYMKKLSETLRT